LWDLANAFETAGQFVDAQMKYAESWKALQKRCGNFLLCFILYAYFS
jgi:hypothetical protein